jgi:DNA invertase Pin-like site-specific DNA recombinase
MRQAVIYLRVSTIEQTTANQERELHRRWIDAEPVGATRGAK